jgi:DNA-binding Lrp family transcriptional regulator
MTIIPGPAQLDDIDHALIDWLRADGRTPTSALAERLGLSRGTVASRIRRLADERILRVVAVTDMVAMGYPLLVTAWLDVEHTSPIAVGEKLATIDEVASVVALLGPHDLFLSLLARDHGHLGSVIERVQAVPGVGRGGWELALDVVKYQSAWGILAEDGHPALPQPGPNIDDLDLAVINLLQRDGRASNRRLAAELEVSEATVRARIRRMEQMGAIRIGAVTDMAAMGMTGFALVGVRTEPGRAPEVAAAMAQLREFGSVLRTMGPHDVVGAVLLQDQSDLLRLVLQDLPAMPGVADVEAGEGRLVLKHSFSWVRLTP